MMTRPMFPSKSFFKDPGGFPWLDQGLSKDTKSEKKEERLGQNLFLILNMFRVPSVVTIQAPAGIGKSSMLKYDL